MRKKSYKDVLPIASCVLSSLVFLGVCYVAISGNYNVLNFDFKQKKVRAQRAAYDKYLDSVYAAQYEQRAAFFDVKREQICAVDELEKQDFKTTFKQNKAISDSVRKYQKLIDEADTSDAELSRRYIVKRKYFMNEFKNNWRKFCERQDEYDRVRDSLLYTDTVFPAPLGMSEFIAQKKGSKAR